VIILSDEEAGVWSRLGDWVEDKTTKMPKTGKGLKTYLFDLLTLVFGEDATDKKSVELFEASVNVNITVTVRVSPNGIRQVATGVDLIQTFVRKVTLIYYEDMQEHHLVCSDIHTAFGSTTQKEVN
jgi:hypothetical protein